MEKLEFFRDLVDSCFVPKLRKNLDEIQITEDDFTEYKEALETQLPLVYDFISQRNKFLEFAEDLQSVEVNVVLLLCEVTSQTAPFKLDSPLVEKASVFLKDYAQLFRVEDKHFFKYYEANLTKEDWKQHIGPIHGLLRFLEWFYGNETGQMTIEWIQFCLSVGLKVHDCYEPLYKLMSLQIFTHILDNAEPANVQKLNIHAVIYDETFKDIYYMESVQGTEQVLSCLMKCLHFFADVDSVNWSHVDDILERVINNTNMASNNHVSLTFLSSIPILCSFFSSNRSELEQVCRSDLCSKLESARDTCLQNTSYTIFRWAKSILEMFNLESHKLFQDTDTCQKILLEIHKCYLICILPIPMPVIVNHLRAFHEKFISVLIEITCHTHPESKELYKMVKDLLLTFYFHLATFPDINGKNHGIRELKDAFKALLEKFNSKEQGT